jgi:hypothetical protein
VSEGFDARDLEERYRVLDEFSPALYAAVLTHPLGSLEARATAIRLVRRALLGGGLPPEEALDWPERMVRKDLLDLLKSPGIARFCRDQPDLTDALLLGLLEVALRPEGLVESSFDEELRELRRIEEERRRRGADSAGTAVPAGPLPPGVAPRLIRQARAAAVRRAGRQALQEFVNEWAARVRVWDELSELFGELGSFLGRGWDLSQGILSSRGWLETVKLAELLKRAPELREVVRTLGRMQSSVDGPEAPSVLERVVGTMRRVREELREIPDARVPAETRGVTLSDDLSRMLPAEAALLAHPRLRLQRSAPATSTCSAVPPMWWSTSYRFRPRGSRGFWSSSASRSTEAPTWRNRFAARWSA